MINNYDKYQTFGPRFLASIVDGLIFLPLGLVNMAVVRLEVSPAIHYLWVLLMTIAPLCYTVILHALYGQTLGKMAGKVKVVDLNENPITFHHAVLRSLPQIFFSFAMIFFSSQFDSNLLTVTIILYSIWSILDIIVFFVSDKRRALHDFVAGTVVIKM